MKNYKSIIEIAKMLNERLQTIMRACEAVIATAHGNRYGLTMEEVLEAQLLAVKELEEAIGPKEMDRLRNKYGWR